MEDKFSPGEIGAPVPPEYRDLFRHQRPLPEVLLAVQPLSPEERQRRVAELSARVKDGVERIQDSAEFRNFLIAMSRFHDYSWNNQMLIMLQRPDATHVAGFNSWKDLGRYVKAGEKGIAILAPLGPVAEATWERATDGATFETRRLGEEWGIYRGGKLVDTFKRRSDAVQQLKDWGAVERRQVIGITHFKIVHVFDINQTEGKPLPEFEVPVLTGEMNRELFDSLLDLMKKKGVTVSFEPRSYLPRGIMGQFSPPNEIWVRPEAPPAQQLKTLLHEIAHYYSVGVFRIPRADAETIAESAAYVVGAHYGFDTGVRSFPYVALWSRDKKVLDDNLDAINKVSDNMIHDLEEATTRLMQTVSARRTPLYPHVSRRREPLYPRRRE